MHGNIAPFGAGFSHGNRHERIRAFVMVWTTSRRTGFASSHADHPDHLLVMYFWGNIITG